MRCLDSIIDSMDMSSRKFWEIVKDREAWCGSPWGIPWGIPWGHKESDTTQ